EDLAHMIESGVVFDVDRVLKWADQLLDALDFLHNQSMPVIHRDIKPQNLKITARDQIILLDFGLAKGNPTDAGHQTAAKSIFGYSRNYASLEQIQGTGTDPRSDLYSLAATLYHLLTGAPPEDALTRAMSVLSSRPDPLVPANSIRAEIPAGVAGVLQTALALNADDRPASAAEMREMFRNSEHYASRTTTTNAQAVATTPAADALAQKTKLMASDTRHEIGGQTDVKTAVYPAYASTETAIRRAVNTGGVTMPKGSKRFVLTASALAAVLIACSTAAGLYFYDAALFGAQTGVPVVAEPQVKEQQPRVTEPANTTGDEAERAGTTNQAEVARPQPAPSAQKIDRASKQPSKENTNVDVGDVHIEGDTVYTGNLKVGPNGITRITPNVGRRPIPPNVAEPFPGVTWEQFNKMPPQEQRKLLEARRRLIMLQRQRGTPQPPPNN
ncbi:MAG TPA: serine/threonine-protein kinase, partial [Pyrinomonadaceae bacterium]|nr:serine/threonine-protein kinase [Pyrinomonadaceae bacterium]